MNCRRKDEGYALLVVMGFAMVMATLLAVAWNYSITEIRIAGSQGDGEAALYVAQGAVERAAAEWAKSGRAPWSTYGTIGRGTYVVAIVPSGMPFDSPRTLNGYIDIDPANPGNYFNAEKLDGSIIDDSALRLAATNGVGSVYFSGNVVRLHFKPGSGAGGGTSQTTLQIDGNPYSMDNLLAYDIFSPAMNIAIYKGVDTKWKMILSSACASFIAGAY